MTYYDFLKELVLFINNTNKTIEVLKENVTNITETEIEKIKIDLILNFYKEKEEIVKENDLENEFNFLIDFMLKKYEECANYDENFLITFDKIAETIIKKKEEIKSEFFKDNIFLQNRKLV